MAQELALSQPSHDIDSFRAGSQPLRWGRYELSSVLGEGGTARVFAAELIGPAGFRKPVALKVLRPNQRDRAALLLREARIVARLHHPHIAQVYDVGEEEGRAFVAMELIDGASLRQLLRRNRCLPAAPSLEVLLQICDALTHAHEVSRADGGSGVVHRDIKPGNILLDLWGRARLVDFGIAQAVSTASEQGSPGWGTPGYTAPEQADPTAQDHRVDLFAIGVIATELLLGARPWRVTEHATIGPQLVDPEKALKDWGLWQRLNEKVPGIAPAIAACLHQDPKLRPDSAHDLREAFWRLTRGMQPSPSLRELVMEYRDANPHAVGTATNTLTGPPVAPPDGGTLLNPPEDPTLLPSVDLLVGRERELERLRLWADSDQQVVTLTGLGGIGKTWLAAAFAESLHSDGRDVLFCDVSSADDAATLCHIVGSSLGLTRLGSDTPEIIRGVTEALRKRPALTIVLDSYDRLTDADGGALRRWLRASSSTRFIITSRRRVRIRTGAHIDLGPLTASSSMELFERRTPAEIREGWPPTERAALETLVTNLEGIPLALCLAAAHTSIPPSQLATILSARFLRMSADTQDVPARQQTLRATLAWSWDRLQPWEQATLAQLSVFRGGFPIPAAEAVVDVSSWNDAPWVPLIIQSLLEQSLLRVVGDPSETSGPRFAMFSSVRTYAAEHLARPVRAGVSTPNDPRRSRSDRRGAEIRHGRHYARLGTRDELETLHRPGGLRRLRELLLERDECIAAAKRGVARQDPEVAGGAALAALRALSERGPIDEGLHLVERVLGLKGVRPRLRARLLLARAAALRISGNSIEAAADYEAVITLAQDSGLEMLEAEALVGSGSLHLEAGRLRSARHHLQAALGRYEELTDELGAARARLALAWVHRDQERPSRAHPLLDRALTVLRAHGDHLSAADAMTRSAWLALERGDAGTARTTFLRALAIIRNGGRRGSEAEALTGLAMSCADLDRVDEAFGFAHRAVSLARMVGDRPVEVRALIGNGILESRVGTAAQGREALEEALSIATRHVLPVERTRAASHLGHAVLRAGDPEKAEALLVPALAAARKMEMPCLEAEVSSSLGLCLALLGRSGAGRAYLRRAEAILRGGERTGALALHLSNLSRVEALRGDRSASVEAARDAKTLAAHLPRGLRRYIEATLAEPPPMQAAQTTTT